jgi:hypothetical protein
MSLDSRPIAEIALDEPAMGYNASPKFRRSMHMCARCDGRLWLRVRFKSGAIIGVVCEDCGWMHTYRRPIELPDGVTQPDIPGVDFEPKH